MPSKEELLTLKNQQLDIEAAVFARDRRAMQDAGKVYTQTWNRYRESLDAMTALQDEIDELYKVL